MEDIELVKLGLCLSWSLQTYTGRDMMMFGRNESHCAQPCYETCQVAVVVVGSLAVCSFLHLTGFASYM
jgi:hypothetical protein